ncbi:hypothetical protein [Tetrasphaera phage TJE1]|uniref:Uncharacterized protein n=1 Tax=Tetrasphaera phage TJE1 TaxID=981335 RepID=G4W949_9CAUD|nr:hypothetical protein G185_gp03 [Tetrasphaera phage TJE1]ADX42537.1 hypothetical protein [Tetrasphaera phage TJE1]
MTVAEAGKRGGNPHPRRKKPPRGKTASKARGPKRLRSSFARLRRPTTFFPRGARRSPSFGQSIKPSLGHCGSAFGGQDFGRRGHICFEGLKGPGQQHGIVHRGFFS